MTGALAAVAELRARLFWRRIAARAGMAEGVSRVLLVALAVPTGVLVAVGLGFGSYQAARSGAGLRATVAIAAISFGLWQTWTATSLSFDDREGFDLRRFLLYPIPPGRLYALGLAAGVVGDPVTLFWSVSLGGVFVGAALGRPGAWLAILAVALAVFAASTILLVALVQEILGVFLESRRAREWGGIVSVALAIGFLAIIAGAAVRPIQAVQEMLPLLQALQWVAWPAAFSAASLHAVVEGRVAASLAWLAGEAVLAAASGWLAYRVALRQARSGGSTRRASGRWDAALAFPLQGARGGLVEKEAKYLVRHPLARMDAVLVPALTALVGWQLGMRFPRTESGVLHALPLFGVAAYTHLAVQPFWLNAFGWERGGARLLFLAPIDPATVLRVKNGVLLGFSSALFVLSAALLVAPGGRPPAWALVGAGVLFAALAPWLYAAGNLVSVLHPRALPFTLRGGHLPALSALLGIAITTAATGLFSLPVLLAARLDEPWVLVVAWALLGLVGLAIHRAALPAQARWFSRRRDEFLPAACGDDA